MHWIGIFFWIIWGIGVSIVGYSIFRQLKEIRKGSYNNYYTHTK